ncbi:MAG: DUF4339 domain-containing protein [Planctomycetota bacterium]
MAPLQWYYAKNNEQHGPVSATELKQLAAGGELKPSDLVWHEGMDEWAPARKIKGLFQEDVPAPPKPVERPPKPPATGGSPSAFENSEAAFERSRRRPRHHVFDRALELARAQFTTQFVDLTSTTFTLAGHYGLYLAMVVLFVFSLLLGVKLHDVNTFLLAVATVVLLFVLQYAAGQFLRALDRLNRSTPARMCSTAFLDCCALVHMFGGLIALLTLAVVAVDTGPLLLVLPAVATFILCQYVAVLALNPESLNLTITAEATAGEEAIGVLSFLVKAGLRIVPVAFGVGIAWGTLTLINAVFLMFAPPENREELPAVAGPEVTETAVSSAESPGNEEPTRVEEASLLEAKVTASKARTILMTFAALPFLAYLFFLLSYLVIDVLRAILSLSDKRDRVNDEG